MNLGSERIAGTMEPNQPDQPRVGTNAVEGYKASMNGDGLRILDQLPQIVQRGSAALTPAEKELLKWIGLFFRKPTPGKFMMRIRMPNGFVRRDRKSTRLNS